MPSARFQPAFMFSELPPLSQVPNIIQMPVPGPGSADGTPFDFVSIYQQAKQ